MNVDLLHLTYYQDIVYTFYLAIDPSQQSKGYGSEITQHLRRIYKNKRLLSKIEKIERTADNYDQRLKRKNSYEKNGFKNTNFEIEKKDIVYEILYSGQEIYEYEYHALFKAYLGRILSFVF